MKKLPETKIKLKKQTKKLGAVQKKILLLLLGGLALSGSRSPSKSWSILKGMRETWKDINKQAAERAMEVLYASKLIEAKENKDGTFTFVLSDGGKKRALTYNAWNMKISRPKVWDKKWRIVVFDIPEDEREARDALRDHLTRLGFHKLQHSVSVYPFDCRDEIEFLVELHAIRRYVRFIIADSIDNELDLRHLFNLP